ncbi:hypothetical protein CK203_024016 [Vitis vinifera]|uniref:Uncharacterized protein n=1 Tax=Vitis vinifera TaxID=29760 RepID=A0A438IQ67_VITVI|nr:hypothetical protein CK203_024016 [Vitis vinifera]
MKAEKDWKKFKSLKLIVLFFWQALKEALAQILLCSQVEALLLKKKSLRTGDSPEVHAEKV